MIYLSPKESQPNSSDQAHFRLSKIKLVNSNLRDHPRIDYEALKWSISKKREIDTFLLKFKISSVA